MLNKRKCKIDNAMLEINFPMTKVIRLTRHRAEKHADSSEGQCKSNLLYSWANNHKRILVNG